jgi:hypothetical protein
LLYKSTASTGPAFGGAVNPVGDLTGKWVRIYESTSGNAGYLYGLTLSNDTITPDTIIDIAAGAARDSTNTLDLTSPSAWTKKINAVWAAGTNNGGFPSGLSGGSPVDDTNYSFWIIGKTDGTIDFGFDSDANGYANTPTNLLADAAGFTLFRLIGYVPYGTAKINPFIQQGNFVYLGTQKLIEDVNDPDASAHSIDSNAPPGTIALMNLFMSHINVGTNDNSYVLYSSLNTTNVAPDSHHFSISSVSGAGNYNGYDTGYCQVVTDSTGKIRRRGDNKTSVSLISILNGWILNL